MKNEVLFHSSLTLTLKLNLYAFDFADESFVPYLAIHSTGIKKRPLIDWFQTRELLKNVC